MNKPVHEISENSISKHGAERVSYAKPTAGVSFASGMAFENISYSIDGDKILEDISLEVEPGNVLCLLGPSGSGKTSLLRIAAGLISNCSGSVSIDGRKVTGSDVFVPPENRGVGLVFQDYALFPHLTLLQNLEFGLTEMNKSQAREQALRMLSRVGLTDRAHDYPHVLSGGEQQRVALARALAPRPGILLMDEPFSGLDARLRDAIRDQSLELLRETRSTAIIVTHDPEEALRVADNIALLNDGKLVQQGTPQALFYNPANLFAASFFSEISSFPVYANNGKVETVFGIAEAPRLKDGAGHAVVRHTDVIVKPVKKTGNGITTRIVSRRFLGSSELLELAIDGLEMSIHARVKPGEILAEESTVLVSVDPNLMMIFPSEDN